MIRKQYFSLFLTALLTIVLPGFAFAALPTPGDDLNTIAENITTSTEVLPGFIAALAYLSGVLIAITAILKTVDHVNNPTQTPIRVPVIRYLLGGALFSLPIVTEAVVATFNGNSITTFSPADEIANDLSGMWGGITSVISLGNVNTILENIIERTDQIPGLIAAIAYLLAVLMTVSALYKTRDHVEDPDRAPIKDAVVRYLIAGALFGLPTVFEAMYQTISDGGLGGWGTLMSLLVGGTSTLSSTETGLLFADCVMIPLTSPNSLGTSICQTLLFSAGIPAFLSAVSYVLGLVFGVWALMKIRDHVTNPGQTPLSEGVTRLIAGGAFFSLPPLAMAITATLTPTTLSLATALGTNTGFVETTSVVTCGGTNSLDEAMGCFMHNTLGPMHVMLNFFCFCAGLIFIMIGISRLIKSSQEGARGPGGMGTVSTFVAGGILLSATTLMRALSDTFFASAQTETLASLTYTGGMSAAETDAAYNVIAAVLKFMIIIGLISFVRGIFIMRDVAEGSQQASVMAGMTHIIGGALAVNLGPLMNAIQSTLGITAFGVTFS